jgi:tRNA pseudouridine38-40 synthase
MRYALLICYDGTPYGGWQIQKNTQTVQEVLQTAFLEAFGFSATITASGRTDAGVHAAGQVAHFDADFAPSLKNAPNKIADALNAHLPSTIRVLKSCAAPEGFDANRSAKRKTYCYRFYVAPHSHPLKDRYAAWVKFAVSTKKLEEAAKFFVGEHDFKAYCSSGSAVKTTVRTIYDITVNHTAEGGVEMFEIKVCGNGFLYNMVRTLAGTMIFYAAEKLTANAIQRSLLEGDRNAVGKTMPPQGLTLESVEYNVGLFN